MEKLNMNMYDYYSNIINNIKPDILSSEDCIAFINLIFCKLCNILVELHKLDVYHLDSHLKNFMIKGENINNEGTNIKLIDFGNSYRFDQKKNKTVLVNFVESLIKNKKKIEILASRKSQEDKELRNTLKTLDFVILFQDHITFFEEYEELINTLTKSLKVYIPEISDISKKVITEIYGTNISILQKK